MESIEHPLGIYLYAVIAGGQECTFPFSAISGAPVRTICDGPVAAVISDLTSTAIRPERRQLAAHHKVLHELLKETTPLPVTFGTIVRSQEEVVAFLRANHGPIIEKLERVTNRVEMGLVVSWNVPNIFDYFVNTHEELNSARNKLLRTDREPSHMEKIEVGQLFELLLEHDREVHTRRMMKLVGPLCDEIKSNPGRSENEVMRLACLIKHSARDALEAGVVSAAQSFDSNFAINIDGPWAPHNFSQMNLLERQTGAGENNADLG